MDLRFRPRTETEKEFRFVPREHGPARRHREQRRQLQKLYEATFPYTFGVAYAPDAPPEPLAPLPPRITWDDPSETDIFN